MIEESSPHHMSEKMEATLFKMPLYLPAQGATRDRGHDHRVARRRGRPLPQGAGAGAGRQREVGLRFRGALRRAGDPALPPRRRDTAADRTDHGDRDRRPGDARLDSAGRGRRAFDRADRGRDRRCRRRTGRANRPCSLGFGGYLPRARGDQRGTGRKFSRNHAPNTSTR